MTTGATLVVGYDEARRASVETTLHRLARRQGISMLVLGVFFGLLIVVPIGAAIVETNDTADGSASRRDPGRAYEV
ncbi:hypothetical protein [Okibacterium fritillariae]|uniref:Uncharacterized protein n=1 Tax=Okibacterium fritillariae TaxID=123320 RepID=A0A1T5IBH7_9MICO|nr:hypothetical protein [Okibacterium fritillariae]SKC36536.1 hypothetical protein SAMN06309945_0210 [Okibacterium fritillariae]